MTHHLDIPQLIGQRLMIGINGTTIDRETKKHLLEIKPGFIILFSRNISSPTQVRTLISHLHQLLPTPPLIAIDQEGGRVIRFTRGVTVFPGNMALGAAGSTTLAYHQGVLSASQLKRIGINLNLAPVVDVITSHRNPGITIRSFGEDSQKVSLLACAFIRGTQKMRVAAVAKHFPGKGAAEADAHYDLPTIPSTKNQFKKIHLVPFTQVIKKGVKGIMSSHIHCPTLDRQEPVPATFSKTIINGYLRMKLRYRGIIFSDDLEMGAIAHSYPIEDACLRATYAGHDVLLICSNYPWQKRAFHALVNAYTHDHLPLTELKATLGRIRKLRSFCHTKVPTALYQKPFTPASLARLIARKAVTILSDDYTLLPINGKKEPELLLLIPDVSRLPLTLEEGYAPNQNHILIQSCRSYFPHRLTFHFFPLNPQVSEIENITTLVHAHRRAILFISNAQGNKGQQSLIQRLYPWTHKLIFALLDNPFDYEFLSPGDTCITSYGLRSVQLQSLVKTIFGKAPGDGTLPFKRR